MSSFIYENIQVQTDGYDQDDQVVKITIEMTDIKSSSISS